MGTTKAGFILALIAGILGILGSVFFMVSGGFATLALMGGIYGIVSSILVIMGGMWMRDEEKCFKGGMIVLIFSLIGAGGLFGLIAGIIGMVKGKKPHVHITGVPPGQEPAQPK